ncbi:MAG: TldD/PmbA family protein [Clostridiales bacterium]|jgi:TldD protein|nr:TldD/PmbA family protein [Clostridiales bacterium]
MISKNLIHDVLTAALSTGGDFAEVFLESTVRNSVSVVNGICEKSVSGMDYGAGIRIFNGLGAVYVYTNDLGAENFIKIAKEAAAAVSKVNALNTVKGFINTEIQNRHKVVVMPDSSQKREVVEILKRSHAASMEYNPLVTQTSGGYADVVSNILIANSNGLWAQDLRVRSRASFAAVASNESEKQTASLGPGACRGFEFVQGLNPYKIGREIAETAVTMLKAKEAPGGKMCVVIENGFGGVIFHEASGHSLEATSVAKNASVFCGKMGEKIASDKVTAIDDATLANEFGSINIDDEGEITRRNVLIENGILKSYMVDKLNGKRMNAESTASARRESYKYAPTSRMTNTFIAPGTDSQNGIISSVDYGLYAKKMGGGSVTPATGEFNFAVVEGYMIRGGKIAEPVRGATLIGKGSDVLLNIDMVADNLELAQGVCGSESGSVPVNVGQPMIRVKEITVGGKE